jgi:asparagine synthase (glutamine-hydrolysing)
MGRARDERSRPQRGEAHGWLRRYADYGDRAPEQAGGGFGVVIVDFRARRALLFVDRFSIETLAYRSSGNCVSFSDSAAHVPGSNTELDQQALYDYLYFHAVPSPQTVYRDVRRIEPAHRVVLSFQGCSTSAYWKPLFVEDNGSDCAERMRRFVELVRLSVETEADEPRTACFLSGGTDSSTVAGMLTGLRGEPADAYSIGFQAQGYDEMAYAKIAERHFGLRHHSYYLTPDDIIRAIPKIAANYDQPFGNSSVLPAYFCALRAREDGFTRMLAGDGGDELFAGNSRYATQRAFQLYHGLPHGLRTRVLEPLATESALFRRVPGFRQLGGYVRHSRLPMPDRLEHFQLLHQLGEQLIFDDDFRSGTDSGRPPRQQRATWEGVQANSLINRMLAYDWKFTLADSDLPKVRGATQLAGVTVGYPFLSRELVDFSLNLPPNWKLKGFRLRWFFKRALRDFLPRQIIRKRKHGFGLPFGHWVLQHPPLYRFVEESLAAIAQRGIVRPEFTRDLMGTRLAEAPGYYGEMAWILMMLEQWLTTHDPQWRSAR